MSNSPASGEAFLVIGGCGFLGATIARALKARGEAYVSVFDIATAREPIEKVTYHTGDLTDPQSFGEAVRSSKSSPGGAEKGVVVIHTASPVHGMGTQVYEKVNVQGTQNVIQVAKDEGVRKLVFTSSAGVVFDGQDLINVDERMPYPEKPMDAYNDTKVSA